MHCCEKNTHHGKLGNVSERILEKTYLMTWAYVGHFEGGFQEAGLCSRLDVFMKQGPFYDCALNKSYLGGRKTRGD